MNPVSTRREALRQAVTGGVIAAGMATLSHAEEPARLDASFRAKSKRVRHSVMAWCFKPMAMEKLIPACAQMGLSGMEGIDPQYYPLMKKHGLAVSLVGSHSFKTGPVRPENHAECEKKLRDAIDRAVQWNCKNVITFTGMRAKGINDSQAEANCIRCWKSVIGYAESKGITLAMEHLNSRDDTHPMKGHPGYFGDDVDHCVDMIKKVDSPNMKLLFDVYHVQIMNGDVIRRFRQYKPWIAHVHTAGVPGRGELDENQELNYAAIIRAILDAGYDGYITHEFIPTWEDKLASLRHGVAACDV